MSKLYSTTNAEALAKAFDRQKDECQKKYVSARTQREERFHLGEAAAWHQAAEMIRNTDFVGWTQAE